MDGLRDVREIAFYVAKYSIDNNGDLPSVESISLEPHIVNSKQFIVADWNSKNAVHDDGQITVVYVNEKFGYAAVVGAVDKSFPRTRAIQKLQFGGESNHWKVGSGHLVDRSKIRPFLEDFLTPKEFRGNRVRNRRAWGQ